MRPASSTASRSSRPAHPGLSRHQLWYGRDEAPTDERSLRAGPVSAALIGPDVARIRLRDLPLIDRIYMAVRDRDWNTVPPVISGLTLRDDAGTTIATFDARNRAGDIDVRWRGTISATPGGALSYAMDAEAGSDFDYCRIGFCILHPEGSAAGRPFRADTIEGTLQGVLPDLIAPQSIEDGVEVPLFPACSRLAVDLDGATVVTEFEGDLFEMEDQRNWTDASFKTYCTPIALGYPLRARRGQRFHQVVRVTVDGTQVTRPSGRRRSPPIEVTLPADPGRPGPRLGVGSASWLGRALKPLEASRLRAISLDHLRVDVRMSAPDRFVRLGRALRDAEAIGADLELALFVADETIDQLAELVPRLAGHPLARILVLHEPTAGTRSTPVGWVARVREELGSAAASVSFATGTDGDFAELNRDRPDPSDADALAYAMNPQVHAFDEASLVQTLATQATTIATARSFARGRSIVASPVTLRQRFNPAASDSPASSEVAHQRTAPLPASVDRRQPSLFAAGWTIGSYASLAGAAASSVTFFETVGPCGLMTSSTIPRVAGLAYPTSAVFPVYHAMADIAGGAGWWCAPLEAGDPDALVGLVMRSADRIRILFSNMTPSARTVRLRLPPVSRGRIRMLDEFTAPDAMSAPARYRRGAWAAFPSRGSQVVRLQPYAMVRIDGRIS